MSGDNYIRCSNSDEYELAMCFNLHHLKIDYRNGCKWDLADPDYDQPRIVSRLGDEKRYHTQSATMLATIVQLLRGTPYVYQGEEIAMTNPHDVSIEHYRDVESLNYYNNLCDEGKSIDEASWIIDARSRDNSRTPVHWNSQEYAGFSTHESWLEVAENYQMVNIEKQIDDDHSVLEYRRALIRLYYEEPVIAYGDIAFIDGMANRFCAFMRTYQGCEVSMLGREYEF